MAIVELVAESTLSAIYQTFGPSAGRPALRRQTQSSSTQRGDAAQEAAVFAEELEHGERHLQLSTLQLRYGAGS
jgi:hypothetical protein